MNLLEKFGWYEWLCHTNFSFLTGASHPHQYVESAAALKYRGLAVTDFDGVYGLARTHLAAKRLEDAERPQLSYGLELHLARDHHLPVLLRDTLVLLATSKQGYQALCRLGTLAHRDGKDGAQIPLEMLLGQDVRGLVAVQPMRGRIRRAVTTRQQASYEERLAQIAAHFQGGLYLAVSRHLHPAEDMWVGATLHWAQRLRLSCLLTQDVFFHHPEQKSLSDVLHAIRCNETLEHSVRHHFPNAERCLRPLAHLERLYRDLPVYGAALEASRQLAESCQFSMNELKYAYPKEMLPEGKTPQGYLEELVWESLAKAYGAQPALKILTLISHELALIQELGFADYFLTVWDIVRWARSQRILCQGRGSAANSAVCFVLGITSVDPAHFDVLFERFMSVERGDPPDIDVDFEHERREEVIQYVYERYGRGRAAMVANVITFRGKGAMRAVGKALGVPEHRLGDVSQLMGERYFRHAGSDEVLGQARHAGTTTAEKEGGEPNLPWELWGDLAEKLKGFPRHLGIHSGGFILSDQPLDQLVALEPATMPGRTVVQWCKDDIEGLGFFKIDLLALGMLTAIRKTFDELTRWGGPQLTLATIPADDLPTYTMIQKADTVGTFQIESRAQMSMLPRLRPAVFYDLVIEVAIVRPGPIQGGMIHPYLRRRSKVEDVTYPDERLRPILARTLGIPIFQEQVMRIAIAVGDFTAGQANELRRNMGAWSMKGDLSPWMRQLMVGMRKNGLKEEFIQSILAQMKGFAHYGFPESHSVSFALLAYASSYLKRHHPAAFFQALLNSQPMGFYAPHALLQSAQRDGVTVQPVCINHSHWDCTIEPLAQGRGELPQLSIRLGLRLVNGLRRQGADLLVQARQQEGGAFQDMAHCLRTAALYRPDWTALAAAGAFLALGIPRKAALWLAEAAPFCPFLEDLETPVLFPEETAMERAEQDFAATSTTLGPHPATLIRDEHWCYEIPVGRILSAKALETYPSGKHVDVFGMVTVRQSPPSANGMVFFTIEDETGFLNLVFTPDQYRRFFKVVERQTFLCVRGRLQRVNEFHSLIVSHVYSPVVPQGDVVPLPRAVADATAELTAKVLQVARNYM